jgi:alkylated DNA repair dioxygenase AlkB
MMLQPCNLLPHGGSLFYFDSFLDAAWAANLFSQLIEETTWQHKQIKMFGKLVFEPRLTSWVGDAAYTYSGVKNEPFPWPISLIKVKQLMEQHTGSRFNSALLNYYRNGQDSMGWHRDNERELGNEPTIASISIGAVRKFEVREYASKKGKIEIWPASGSLLLMAGTMQTIWEHQIPKQLLVSEPRINITFRWVK